MPQQIEVPGMGVVEFPDGMTDDAIATAIRKNMPADQLTMRDVGRQAWTDLKKAGSNIAGAIHSAVTLPRDVVTGSQPMPMPGQPLSDFAANNPEAADKLIGRVTELASVGSPINPAARAGDMAIPGAKKVLTAEKVKPPTAQALKDAADQGYKSAREMGVEIDAKAVHGLSAKIQSELEQDGVIGELAPKTFAIIQKLQSAPDKSFATIAGIDAARRAFGQAAADFTNPTERLAASRAIERLDDFLSAMPQEAVLAGPAAAAGEVIGKARGNYAAGMRSDKVTGAAERAELNAAVANSGQNLDNATRQRIRDLLVKPKEARGYSPEELAQMEHVARGSVPTNVARALGNILGGGGGLGATVTGGIGAAGGAIAGGVTGAAVGATLPPIAGAVSKKIANALTGREVRKLDEMVRKRSPLYEDMSANPLKTAPMDEKRAAILRALLLEREQ